MAELVDAPDLGSGSERSGGSSPPPRTNESSSYSVDFSVGDARYGLRTTADEISRPQLVERGDHALDLRVRWCARVGVVALRRLVARVPQAGGHDVSEHAGCLGDAAGGSPEPVRRDPLDPSIRAQLDDFSVGPVTIAVAEETIRACLAGSEPGQSTTRSARPKSRAEKHLARGEAEAAAVKWDSRGQGAYAAFMAVAQQAP